MSFKINIRVLKIALLGLVVVIILVASLFGYKDIPLEELKEGYAPSPSAFISVNGMDVHYRDEGNPNDSVPIVLLHGTGSSLHTFDDWVAELKNTHRVIRMDLPAFGLTGPFPNRDYSIENYVTFLEKFLESNEIDKCMLAGNSLGGWIAWEFTIKNPEAVDKLILIDAAGYPFKSESAPIAFRIARIPVLNKILTFITPKPLARASVENVYADKSKVTGPLVDRYFNLTLREGNRQALVDRMTLERNSNSTHLIKEIHTPTLIIWGDQDMLIPVDNAFRFHDDLPNDTLVILKGVGHVPMEETPGESLVIVMEFLEAQKD